MQITTGHGKETAAFLLAQIRLREKDAEEPTCVIHVSHRPGMFARSELLVTADYCATRHALIYSLNGSLPVRCVLLNSIYKSD